jgi:competence protein ComEA
LIVAALAVVGLARTRPAPAPVLERARPLQLPAAGALRALREGEALDLNRASAADLQLLPGVGPKLAARIVEERTRRGSYARLADLLAVRGIGAATLARLEPFVKVDASLTSRTAVKR